MKKNFLSTGLALLLCLGCAAQHKNAVQFSSSINREAAFKHLSVLASDEFEGRETGKKGAWMAADYIRNYFRAIGLKGPVNGDYFQPVGVVTHTLEQAVFTVDGQAKEEGKDFMIPVRDVNLNGFTFNTDQVLFAGYGLERAGYNDFAGNDPAGKTLMIFAAGDPDVKNAAPAPADRASRKKAAADLQAKLKDLSGRGARAVLIIDPAMEQLSEEMKMMYRGNGQLSLKTPESTAAQEQLKEFPVIRITPALADEILKAGHTSAAALQQQISSTGKPAPQLISIPVSGSAMKKETSVRAENVLGFLEGSDPVLKKEILVVTAHYDHIGLTASGTDKVNNGADDDGSGTTGVLLIADAFAKAKKAGRGPKRSILFMTVVGEEKGLLGSEWYASHPVFPLQQTITNLNIDMIGRVDKVHESQPEYIYIIGSDMLSSDLNRIGIAANELYTHLNLDMTYNNRTDPNQYYYRSDHYNFAKHGVPVIFYFNGVHADYHQPGDEISKINFDLLTKRAQLVYYTAWELANGPKRPVVDKNADGTPKK